MKPLIGITVGEIVDAQRKWRPIVYGQNRTYTDAIERAGGIPLLIPLMSDNEALEQLYTKLQGILFAGGNDLSPSLYGEAPYHTTNDMSEFRDSVEVKLIRWAIRDSKPILGICRGMQLLNVVAGGTLYQHVLSDVKHASDHTLSNVRKNVQFIAHQLKIKPGSKLARILDTQAIGSNTSHHQAIKIVADRFEAVAWSEDGIIEAVETLDEWYAFGIQCHPESLEAIAVPDYRKLFESFVTACAGTPNKVTDISQFLAAKKTPVLE